MRLSIRTKYCAIVLRDNNICPSVEKVKKWCDDCCEEYAFILHDKDVKTDGSCVPKHIHIVCTLKKVTRLSTTLNSLVEFLPFKAMSIQIDKPTSYESCIQYLVHKNDEGKYQYKVDDIITNIDKEDLQCIIDYVTQTISFEYVFKICLRVECVSELIREIGFTRFNTYKNTIMLIWDDVDRMRRVKDPRFQSEMLRKLKGDIVI